jgi:hypothetical protein
MIPRAQTNGRAGMNAGVDPRREQGGQTTNAKLPFSTLANQDHGSIVLRFREKAICKLEREREKDERVRNK